MEIEVEKINKKDAVVKLSGRLDMNTSPDLRKASGLDTYVHLISIEGVSFLVEDLPEKNNNAFKVLQRFRPMLSFRISALSYK